MKRMFLLLGSVLISLFCFKSSVFGADGFGESATGGASGATVTVENLADFEYYAESTSPYIIRVSGTIDIGSSVNIRSDKTIRGVNSSSTLVGQLGFQSGSSNIIIEGLNITNPDGYGEGDGISIKSDITDVFITRCAIYECTDGCLDITNRSDYITVSWCKFYYTNPNNTHRFVNLVGSTDNPGEGDPGKLHVTFHHNWWADMCRERMPRVRFGQVHVYNNYYDCHGNNYCIRPTMDCQILVENNYFNQVDEPIEYNETGALVEAHDNIFDNCTNVQNPGTDDVFDPPYTYTLDNAADVPAIVMAGAGPVPGVEFYYVDKDATGNNDGSSWENAFKYLQDALDAVPSDAEIRVAEGVYKPDEDTTHPDGSGDRAATFQLKNDVAIMGGYAGYGAADSNERDPNTYETILSGDLNGDDGPDFANNGENSYHVVTGSNNNATAVLDGFTITAGNANGSLPHNMGGGMFNNNGSPTLTNCTFSGNSAVERAGGMYNINSSPTLTNCILSDNASGKGAALCNYDNSNPTVTNCTFTGNAAEYYGGGVFNYNSSPTLTNCILWDNTAPNGPQIYNEDSSPTVSYSDVEGGWPGTGNIDADPLFVGPAGSDFHLLPDSPCIDAGDNTSVPAGITMDLDGNPRIRGPVVDMGAYESPAVIFVDLDAVGANDGSSWDDAFNYLQDALAIEWLVDEIRVAEGVYKPDEDTAHPHGSGSRTATFQLENYTTIMGGYAGFSQPDPDARDIEQYETILSGDLNGDDGPDFTNNGENSYHVVTGSGTDKTAVLDGFTITAGNANADYPDSWGGGMLNDGGGPTVTNCTFGQNSSQGQDFGFGGGMLNFQSNPTLTNCKFRGNRATYYGGGIFNYYRSNPIITNCTFNANSTQHSSNGLGGAVFNYDDSSPAVINSVFIGNSAVMGGSIFNYHNSNPAVTNAAFIGNSAELGGALFNYENSNPAVINSIFIGNSADLGGGMFNFNNSNPVISNCILWNNTALSGPQIYNEASSPTVSYSDVQGGWPGTGNIDADPLFVAPEGNDFHLLKDSPCIDAGDNTAVPAGVTTDLGGNPRFIDHPEIADTGNGTAPIVDMGAYEYKNTLPIANAGPNQVAYAWIDGIADVTLDGSASYDADGDELAYLWTWTIDGNTYDTNGVDPTIELPVGIHTIELVVNDGWVDSEPNYVTVTVVEPIEGSLWMVPRFINGRCGHQRIMAMLRLPAGITRQQIDARQKLLLYPGQIEADCQVILKHFEHGRERVVIFAFFDKDSLVDAVGSSGPVQLDVVGQLKTGQYFYGSDTVRIFNPPRRPPWQ